MEGARPPRGERDPEEAEEQLASPVSWPADASLERRSELRAGAGVGRPSPPPPRPAAQYPRAAQTRFEMVVKERETVHARWNTFFLLVFMGA